MEPTRGLLVKRDYSIKQRRRASEKRAKKRRGKRKGSNEIESRRADLIAPDQPTVKQFKESGDDRYSRVKHWRPQGTEMGANPRSAAGVRSRPSRDRARPRRWEPRCIGSGA